MSNNRHLSLSYLINEYEKTHMNPTNRKIHMICVPAIVFATLGLFWGISGLLWGPATTSISLPVFALLNAGTMGALLAGAYYARLNRQLFFIMTVYGLVSLAVTYGIHTHLGAWTVFSLSAGVWLIAWVIQFIGHKIEGAKPSFLEDLVFLLVGPAFVIEKIFRTQGKSLINA